jgi:hypothetical protein
MPLGRKQCRATTQPSVKRTYWYLVMSCPMSFEEYSYSFLLLPKMKTATSTEHRTESSCAFLKRPPFLLRKVLRNTGISLGAVAVLGSAWKQQHTRSGCGHRRWP